jgi:mevalonate kinase
MLLQSLRSERISPNREKPSRAWARAPGKIILAGEQFVVLGAPAISMAIDLYSTVEVDPVPEDKIAINVDIPLRFLQSSNSASPISNSAAILRPLRMAVETTMTYMKSKNRGVNVDIECEIPVAAGLGSSASTNVAIISAVSRSQGVALTKPSIFELAFVPERFLHGRPSGVDQATSIYGGTLQFSRRFGVKPIRVQEPPVLLICDTGIHHKTGTLVGSVVRKSRTQKEKFREYLAKVTEISNGVMNALKKGDSKGLGELMLENHGLLQKVGVSHPKLDQLVDVAMNSGALGAKLTGAGGGGCMIAVCESALQREKIAGRLKREGGTPYIVSPSPTGVESHLA